MNSKKIKEKMKQIDKRWNIPSSVSDEESFEKFKQRILNIFKWIEGNKNSLGISYDGIDEIITNQSIFDFCQQLSIDIKWKTRNIFLSFEKYSTNIIDYLSKENNKKTFTSQLK